MGIDDDNLKAQWEVPAYLPYVQPPLTAEAVAEAERVLEVFLPPSFLRLLEIQNGGYLRNRLPEVHHELLWGIGPGWPSLTKSGDEWLAELPGQVRGNLVPFDGDGHTCLCLDYSGGGPSSQPAVAQLDLEDSSKELLFESFDEFLDALRPATDYPQLGVAKTGAKASDVCAALAKPLRLKFEAPDSSAHGYPTTRAKLPGKKAAWVWVSPNQVPRAFLRDDETAHPAVMPLLDQRALRFPDWPPDAVEVVMTDEAAARKARQHLEELGFTLYDVAGTK